jgi:hypothetical protein
MADHPEPPARGPTCSGCGKDTKGEPAVYMPAPKQGGPFYYCSECRPPVNFLGAEPPAREERRWHLIDAGEEGVKAARWPNTVHHGSTRETIDFNATVIPEHSLDELREERDRYRAALEELAANRHGFHRPAGRIAREALTGRTPPPRPGTDEYEEWARGGHDG